MSNSSIKHTQPASQSESYTVVNEAVDYVEDEKRYNSDKVRFEQLLNDAKSSALTAVEHMGTGNRHYYRYGIKVMFLFHAAKVSGHLETLMKEKTGKTYKSTVNHGQNFAPIIDLVWAGITLADVPLNKSNRLSRALNHLYKVWGEVYGYAQTAEDELVEYIISNGGINGLVKYSTDLANKDEHTPDLKADKETLKEAAAHSQLAIASSVDKSLEHFRNMQGLPTVNFQNDIPINEGSFSLVLVGKKSKSSYVVVDNFIESDEVEKAVAKSYLAQLGTLPTAIRFLVETLSTQCCPAYLEKPYKTLIDEASKHAPKRAQMAYRRLIFKKDEGTFLLSNTYTKTGLITLAKPKSEILDQVDDDVALAPISRRGLEKYLISPKDYQSVNFNKELGSNPIPMAGSGFTHSIKATIPQVTKDGNSKEFWIWFHKEPITQLPMAQANIKNLEDLTVIWERTVDRDWFKQFNTAFTRNWIFSHGRHNGRPHQSILELVFRNSSVTVNFFNLENKSDLSTVISVNAGNKEDRNVRALYLSKDFAIAMIQLGEMKLIQSPKIRIYREFMRISCETEVGCYDIFVQSSDSSGNQESDGISTYTMICANPEEDVADDDVDFEDEGAE